MPEIAAHGRRVTGIKTLGTAARRPVRMESASAGTGDDAARPHFPAGCHNAHRAK
jgi:hypothetical protein